jgi:hypothetical protein
MVESPPPSPVSYSASPAATSPDPTAQLLMETRSELYSAGSIIARSGEQADRLMVLVSGMVGPPSPNIPTDFHLPANHAAPSSGCSGLP